MKKITKFICAVAATVTAFTATLGFGACSSKASLLDEKIVDDNYDNYYEIFVYSYADSNGDGYGDLNGITSKLDYIRDMGYTGIWLMPIHPSASYHGYDVTDYYNVKSTYGTLSDYENLVAEAHERGIKVIIDLVVNHTSSNHPWFTAALASYRAGNMQSKYVDWYTFARSISASTVGYNENNGIYYESNFDKGMPDLNLKSEAVREEIGNIMKFWIDKGTDGFRLDGCKYYCREQKDSIEFCKWLKDTATGYDEDVYIVGEDWSDRAEITNFYTSGVDSFFYFPAAGNVRASITTGAAAELWKEIRNCEGAAGEGIPAPFLSNHDNGQGRIAGRMSREEDKIKFAYGLLSIHNGNTFTYYGDEIGMVSKVSSSDPDLRVSMYWDDNTAFTKSPPGASPDQEYLFGSVEKQLKDGNSILNYYKLCNNTRNAFPALMRGKSERISYEDENVLAFSREYNGEKVTVVINLSTEKKTVEGIEGKLVQKICIDGNISQSGTKLSMPGYSIAILT